MFFKIKPKIFEFIDGKQLLECFHHAQKKCFCRFSTLKFFLHCKLEQGRAQKLCTFNFV